MLWSNLGLETAASVLRWRRPVIDAEGERSTLFGDTTHARSSWRTALKICLRRGFDSRPFPGKWHGSLRVTCCERRQLRPRAGCLTLGVRQRLRRLRRRELPHAALAARLRQCHLQTGFQRALTIQWGFQQDSYNAMGFSIGALQFNRMSIGPLQCNGDFNRALTIQWGFNYFPHNSMGFSIGPLQFNRISIGPLQFNGVFNRALTIQPDFNRALTIQPDFNRALTIQPDVNRALTMQWGFQ